jgi:hypothetical protein
MARCAVIPHRGPSTVPPCKAAWLLQPGGLAAPSRWPASAYVLPSSDVVAAAKTRACRPRPPPRLRSPILSGWELRIRSLSAAFFFLRSITRSQKAVIALRVFSPASKALIIAGGERPLLFPLSARGAAPPTLDSAPACAAPSPPPHRCGGTLLMPPSLFDTGTHRSNRARLRLV